MDALPANDHDFRLHVREWLAANFPPELRFPTRRLDFRQAMAWHRTLAAKGWVAPGWPREYGGMGLSAYQQVMFSEELDRAGVVVIPNFGITMLGPLLLRFGTAEQKARYLPKILSGEHLWCQGYSEPGAGSDLASLRTSAEPDGDDWVINGQKIWTTMAQQANRIFLLVRTDKSVKKQNGISFLLVPMDSPGITVRPIDNIGGYSEFAEVFFDNVRVPRTAMVGEVNQGWTMAKALLGAERILLGSPKLAKFPLQRLEALARTFGLLDEPVFRARFVRLAMEVEDMVALYVRLLEVLRRGAVLGEEVSVLKLAVTELFQQVTDLMLEAAGEYGGTDAVLPLADGSSLKPVNPYYLSRPATIYGGSSEVQRNILAKALLKLPG
ncbi:MAG: acyl-CoA dehydrogenase family protein [Gammaproteobacteria bacterium]|nr:acyl-CoA dehydrogenase family protein [Gammaproteobacteria bacterium]MBK8131282.1 acyl-CoA dehydrogenase family protein [Gammaproteobacteria bacterium]MBK9428421.1 acyl-CoA dehydrogenase family protein [Gammaproteobacteria bacterium]